MEATSTTPTPKRRLRSRLVVGTLTLLAMLAALSPSASAGWLRGVSDITTHGEDISVCADAITIGSELVHQVDSFDFSYPSFSGTIGDPYPGNSTHTVPLYGSAADALARTNPVVTFAIPITYVGLTSGGNYEFIGEDTQPTPAGYGNGQMLYAWAIDDSLTPIAFPLTIGDPSYGCPPEDLPWAILTNANEVKVNAYLPHTIIFDSSSVDPATLAVTGDGGMQGVNYLGSFGNLGFARVNLNEVGLTCDTTTLTLDGVDAGFYPFSRDIAVTPFGRACEAPS